MKARTDEINAAALTMWKEVLAAAKAMYEHTYNRDQDLPWEKCGPRWQQSYLDQATVALIAASKVNDEQ